MELVINDLTWEVKFMSKESLTFDNLELCGLTQKVELEILLNEELKLDLSYRTIIHELVHAYLWSYGLENNDGYSEENLANFVEGYMKNIGRDADLIFNELCKRRSSDEEVKNKKSNKKG